MTQKHSSMMPPTQAKEENHHLQTPATYKLVCHTSRSNQRTRTTTRIHKVHKNPDGVQQVDPAGARGQGCVMREPGQSSVSASLSSSWSRAPYGPTAMHCWLRHEGIWHKNCAKLTCGQRPAENLFISESELTLTYYLDVCCNAAAQTTRIGREKEPASHGPTRAFTVLPRGTTRTPRLRCLTTINSLPAACFLRYVN
ncbi:hypothetical protein EXN66_Car003935 [Channa argus]|uniref:Uncharacterized protein n=1 Tax=Channa argus TaxID=215402 RepID=A0A6G1PDH8_CHAAH|nr:hypothetical protein EXN66_Car003935 [Channa argus]